MEYIDIARGYSRYKELFDEKLNKVLNRGSFILGDEVISLEEKIAKYVGREFAIACGSGTDALQLILMAYGIGEGDAVFCPDMTFIASIEPAILLGAHPVFCDIDNRSYNLLPDSLEREINRVISEGKYKPRAVVAVDFLGNPYDADRINEIGEKYNLLVIEDAAQGFGASRKGKKCGMLGKVSFTSFFPTKPLGCFGDGGAVFTDDSELCEVIKSLRVHGKGRDKYETIRVGINSRLDTIQAAILLVKMSFLDEEILQRQRIANIYNNALKDYYYIPFIESNCISSYAQYIVATRDKKEREEIQSRLKARGIPTLRYYPNPLHKMPIFAGALSFEESYDKQFGNAIWYSDCTFGIPFHPFMDNEEIEMIIDVMRGER